MGKHESATPDDLPPRPAGVSDDTWTKILVAALSAKDGDLWAAKMARAAARAPVN